MADISTGDLPPSKVRDEVILEAKRLEERTRDSSKGHHCAAEGWTKRGMQLGVPALIISTITSAAVFVQAAKDLWWLGIIAGLLSVLVTVLTTLTTFLKPNEREGAHLTAANAYDRLNNDARVFASIDCWSATSTEAALTAKLNEMIERKNKLNEDSPQVPPWAWNMAQARIKKGEADYAVDKVNRSSWTPGDTSSVLPAPAPAPLPEPQPASDTNITFAHGRTRTVVVKRKPDEPKS